MTLIQGIDFEKGTIVAIISAGISILAMCSSIIFSLRSSKQAEVSLKLAEFNMRQQMRDQLRAWASLAVDEISQAYILATYKSESDENHKKEIINVLSQLTSSIDKGRWFLPNVEHERYGLNKESAYTGIRQDALDYLVWAYDETNKMLSTPDIEGREVLARRLSKIKRKFVSATQNRLEPRAVEEDLKKMSKSAESK